MNFSSKSEIFTNSTAYKVTSSESNHFWHLLYQESEQFLNWDVLSEIYQVFLDTGLG